MRLRALIFFQIQHLSAKTGPQGAAPVPSLTHIWDTSIVVEAPVSYLKEELKLSLSDSSVEGSGAPGYSVWFNYFVIIPLLPH